MGPAENKQAAIEQQLYNRMATAQGVEKIILATLIRNYKQGNIPAVAWLALANHAILGLVLQQSQERIKSRNLAGQDCWPLIKQVLIRFTQNLTHKDVD